VNARVLTSTDLLHVRASSLPLLMLCAGAAHVQPGELRLNETSAPARSGTAGHAVARRLPEVGSVDWDSIPRIAHTHGVDAKELRILAGMATRLWWSELPSGVRVCDCFPNALTEVPLGVTGHGLHLTGHGDFLSVTDTVVRVGDWKFGWKDSDYGAQLRGYAALVLLEHQELTEATSTVLWVRDNDVENYTMERAEAEVWFADLGRHIRDWDGVYHPGTHCEWCQRAHACEAAAAQSRKTIQAFSPEQADLAKMTPDELYDVLAMAHSASRYAERAIELIRGHVIRSGTLTGKRYELTTKEQPKRYLRPIEGFEALQAAGFTDDDMAEVMALSIGAAEQVAKSKVKKGKGAQAIRDLNAQLEEAGAVIKTTGKRLVTRRIA